MKPLLPILILASAAALAGAPTHAHPGPGAQHAALHPAMPEAGAPASAADRVVTIGMHDSMRFAPAQLQVQRGETLQFELVNEGQVMHELVLGSPADIAHHRAAMLRDPAMAHAGPGMAHVAPGERASMRWQFSQSGSFEYACLLPGHYEAGMRGAITVRE